MGSINIINWTESEGTNPLVLFDNLLVGSTPSVPNAENALTESTYDAFTFNLDQAVEFDLGESKEFNSFAIVGPRNVGEVSLSYSEDDIEYFPITVDPIPTGTSDCALYLFNKKEARYLRVEFVGEGSASVRSLWLSEAFEFPGGVGYGYTPVWLSQDVELMVSKTLNGQFVGNREISKGATTVIPMIPEERHFVENDLQPFMQHYNKGKAFIWAAGPAVFTKDVAYVWRQQNSEIKPAFDQSGNWMSFQMSVEGYVT